MPLPAEFADLEPYAAWAWRPSRSATPSGWPRTMDEMQAFYDAAFPRLEARSTTRQVPARRPARRRPRA